MKKSLVMVIIVMVILSAVLAGCAEARQQANTQPKDKPDRIIIASASAGGTFYAFAGGFATLLKENLGVGNVDITNSGGAVNVVKTLEDPAKGQMGANADATAYAGWNGTAPFDKKYQNVRLAMPLYTSINHMIVKAKSPIKSFSDLNGKVVQIGEPAMSGNLRAHEIFTALGIKPAKLVEAPIADALTMFDDNLFDAMMIGGYMPEPNVSNTDAIGDIRIIPLTDEEIQKITAMYPYLFKASIPKGTYRAAKEDIPVIANSTSWYVNKDLSETFVYNLVKETYANKEKLAASADAAKDMDPKQVLETGIVPLHPGALKYYKEIGLTIPDKLLPPDSK
jgi:TRAP transporter TAXI family solute receptor